MANIPIGAKREDRLLVTGDVAIDFLGMEAARVLSTPHLIGYLEMTARNLIQECLPPGWDSVGTHVDLSHLAATPVGMAVRLCAEVISSGDRRVTCRVEAYDEREKIAEGTHERVLVDVARFAARVAAKAAGQ
ncbi:MAG: thioesterase [Bryobacteraceae bacterium]|jgi:predicted thioesterase